MLPFVLFPTSGIAGNAPAPAAQYRAKAGQRFAPAAQNGVKFCWLMKSDWDSQIDGRNAAVEFLQDKVGISEQIATELFRRRG